MTSHLFRHRVLEGGAAFLASSLILMPLLAGGIQACPPCQASHLGSAGQAERGQEARKGDPDGGSGFLDIKLTDCLLVLVGGLQAWLIFRQVGIADRQTGIAERQAGIAERQAGITADQLALTHAIERPLVLLNHVRCKDGSWRTRPDAQFFPDLMIALGGYGRSAAIVDRCQIGIVIGVAPPERSTDDRDHIASQNVDNGKRRFVPYSSYYSYGALLAGSHAWQVRCDGPVLTAAQVYEIGTGKQRIWVDGLVTYHDAGHRQYETHFRFVYDHKADFFVPDETAPEFNRHT